MFRCTKCGQLWHDERARDNEQLCTRRCGGTLVPAVSARGLDLEGCDLGRLPYPVALTADRLAAALRVSGDVLKVLFRLKDCFEAAIKYVGVLLLAEYRQSRSCTPDRNAELLKVLVKPMLGHWVHQIAGALSLWLLADGSESRLALIFAQPGKGKHGRPTTNELLDRCAEFVSYRNDALGHGALRSDTAYESDLHRWLPLIRQLLDAVGGLSDERLCLVTDRDRCQVWMGPRPAAATEPGDFHRDPIGHFVLRGPGRECRDLYPFLCYLPDSQQEMRLHFYDTLYRYSVARKEVNVLEYDHGSKQARAEPVAGLEETFTADLLAAAFGRHRGRMEVIEGRVANFGMLIESHAAIVGRRLAIEHVQQFLRDNDRGLLLIQAAPGKGKTALMAHLVEEVFGHLSPPPVCFFYRRTAGITDPDVCVRSLYHALLEAHDLTEAEESKRQTDSEPMFFKLVNLLQEQIAPKLVPGRPQLIFLDGLDEAQPTSTGKTAFARIPEELPAGVYVIATTRPVVDRTALARRPYLHGYDLDSPDLLPENLRDGMEFVGRELVGSGLSPETVAEIAHIGAGNFLVLKLLCGHAQADLMPTQVSDFLRRLAADGGIDQLGFIYAEFWERLIGRLSRQDRNLLVDVAGLLLTAQAPLTAEIICAALHLRSGDWDFALRHLIEYLTVDCHEEDGACETFYRFYHESFADFVRAKVATDQKRFHNLLADYCRGWSQLPEGYGRTYALRFGPTHLMEAKQVEAAVEMLLDWRFLEAKTWAGQVFELADDLTAAIGVLPEGAERNLLVSLEESLRRDIHFIHRHGEDYPQGLFQCLWNNGWWCAKGEGSGQDASGGLRQLLRAWREAKERQTPGFRWLRCLYPICEGLNSPPARVAFSPDGKWIAVGSYEWVLVYEVSTDPLTNPERVFFVFESDNTALAWSPDSRFLATGSEQDIKLWSMADERNEPVYVWRQERKATNWDFSKVMSLAFSPDGRRLAVGGSDGQVVVREVPANQREICLEGTAGAVLCLAFAPDGVCLAGGSDEAIVQVWDSYSGKVLHRFTDHDELWNDPDPNFIGDIWEASPVTEAIVANKSLRGVVQVAYSFDGSRIASGGRDGKAIVRSAVDGMVQTQAILFQTDIGAAVNSDVFPWLPVLDGPSGELSILSSQTGGKVAWFPGEVECARVHPSGRIIAGLRGNEFLLLRIEGSDA